MSVGLILYVLLCMGYELAFSEFPRQFDSCEARASSYFMVFVICLFCLLVDTAAYIAKKFKEKLEVLTRNYPHF